MSNTAPRPVVNPPRATSAALSPRAAAPTVATRPAVAAQNETAVVARLRTGDLDGFLTTFEQTAGPAALPAWRTLLQGDASLLAVVCRNSGLSRAAFSAMVILSDRARAPNETERLLASFERKPQATRAA